MKLFNFFNKTNRRTGLALAWLGWAILLLCSTPSFADFEARMVKDIISGSDSSLPQHPMAYNPIAFNNKLYFKASDGIHGSELWVYDGTTDPSMVLDINSGSYGSNPLAFTVFNNKLYFSANDGISGSELWVYDGTTDPSIVHDINSGSYSSTPTELTEFNNKLYFTADDGIHGRELWFFDGTNASLAQDFNNGSTSTNPKNLTVFDDQLYFLLLNGTYGLWAFDGTNASMLQELTYYAFNLTVFDNKLYFVHESALWVYDGTSASIVHDAQILNAVQSQFTVFDNKLYYVANDGTHGRELWVYDGTDANMVQDIYSGSTGSSPEDLTVFDNKLYFGAESIGLPSQLWFYDGTLASRATSIGNLVAHTPSGFEVFNNELYFRVDDGTHGDELWCYGFDCNEFGGSKLQNIITFPNPGNQPEEGSPFTLNATADSELPVSYISSTTSVCTVSDDTVTIVSTGDCTIIASQTGNITYDAAIDVSQTFTIGSAVYACNGLGNRGYSRGPGVTSDCAMATDNQHFFLSYDTSYNKIRGNNVYATSMFPAPESHQLLGNVLIDSYISSGVDCDLSSVLELSDFPSSSYLDFTANTKYCYYVKTDTHYIVIGGTTKSTTDEEMTADIAEFIQYNSNGYPTFTSPNYVSIAEGQTSVLTVTATDPEGADIIFSLLEDYVDSFSIDQSTGVLTFNTAPDYETDDYHVVGINISDGSNTNTQYLGVTVTDVIEGPADITDPTRGATLTGDSQIFSLTNYGTVTNYQIQVGTTVGRNDIADSGIFSGTVTSQTLDNLPTDDSTVYVRLWCQVDGEWLSQDYEFSGSDWAAPTINSPVSGTLILSGQAFSWSDTGADNYQLHIGTNEGSNNIYDSGQLDSGTTTSQSIDNLPVEGTTVHVRVWGNHNGKWISRDQQFTVGASTPPTMLFLNTGDTLTSSEQTFTWSDVGASYYWIQIGSSAGRNDLYDSDVLTGTEQLVSDLPTDASTIYVRVWYKFDGRWNSINDHYLAAGVPGGGITTPPTMTPSNGTTLSGTSQTFVFNDNGASNYWLQVGTGKGRNDIYDNGPLNGGENHSEIVSGLPTSGTIYVRVWYYTGSRWLYDDLTYIGSP